MINLYSILLKPSLIPSIFSTFLQPFSINKMSNQELIVCKNFRLLKKLGTGAFGEIYLAQNRTNKDQKFAAKLEQAMTKFPQLYFQAKTYKYLNSSGSVIGIPRVYAMTTEGKYNIMLMDLLGKSIEDIFVDQHKKMSLKSVLMLTEQMVERIQYLHHKQIIHRDIKPDNFLMGTGKNSYICYVVDLGLSKKFIKDNKHIPYKEGKELTGTARYASINTHIGIEQSRRDDIESIGYVMMYLLRGILPWQNMKAKDTKTKYKMILDRKMSTPAEVLCKGFPSELAKFINYAKGLKFQEQPDYDYLKSLLNAAKKTNHIVTDYVYDWTIETEEKITKEIPLGAKINQSVSKQIGVSSVNKHLQHQKSNNIILHEEKSKQTLPIHQIQTSSSLQNKKPILQLNSASILKPPVQIGNTLNVKYDSRLVMNHQKIKTLSEIMNGGYQSSSKALGPKISVVKH